MQEHIGGGWDVPEEVKSGVEFHWFHVPVGGALLLCALSREPLWYVGHFHGGRMRRCTGDNCDLCCLGLGRQIRYVVSAVEVSTRRRGVLEVGQGPASVLRDRAMANGTLRGTVFELFRSGRSKHNRLEVAVLEESPPGWLMGMEALDLNMVLSETWSRERTQKGVVRHASASG